MEKIKINQQENQATLQEMLKKKAKTKKLLILIGCLAGIIVLFYFLTMWKVENIIIFCDLKANGWGWIPVVFVIISIGFVVYCLGKWIKYAGSPNNRGQSIKLLGSLMLLFFAIGWLLFYLAISSKTEGVVIPSELLLRSLLASLDLFMLDIDSNLLDEKTVSAQLRGMISFVAVLSFACTVGLIVSLVYSRLKNYLKLLWRSKVSEKRPHLYVFWGFNDQHEQLAKSIDWEDKTSIKIFVEQSQKSNNDTDVLNGLVNMVTHKNGSFKIVERLNARLSVTDTPLSQCSDVSDDILQEASLQSVKKKVKGLTKLKGGESKPECHIFFLSDNEEENVLNASIIKNDKTMKTAAESGVKVVIYCHARRDSINSVIEDNSLSDNIQVKIIDSAHISVELLKKQENSALYPVNFVKVENDGTVSSGFNSLVVGFGQTGRDVVRYLYEFGAFVYSNKSRGIRRSPFCCHVVDNKMDELAPHWRNTHLRESEKPEYDVPLVSLNGDNAYVNLHNYDYRKQEFQTLLDSLVKNLHYIVIATGDDLEGITLVVRILKTAMRNGKDMGNFKILVRSYSKENLNKIQNIADYYNKLIDNQFKKTENEEKTYEPIVIFGKFDEIYTYDTIVSDKMYWEAVRYYNSYEDIIKLPDEEFFSKRKSVKQKGRFVPSSKEDIYFKDRRRAYIQHIDNKKTPSSNGGSAFYGVMSVKRMESQDLENAFHRHEKRILALKALINRYNDGKKAEEKLHEYERKISDGTIKVPEADKDGKTWKCKDYTEGNKTSEPLNTIMHTLAQTEHLRWNASHEMLGFAYGKKKDDLTLTHNCLTDWDGLPDNRTKEFDFKVVDTSFKLVYDDRKKKKSQQ